MLPNSTSVPELGKLLYENNILLVTSYFYKEVIYYSCILLYQKSKFVILLVTFKSNNIMLLVTELLLKFTYEHVCRTLFLLRKPDFYEEYTESNILPQKVICDSLCKNQPSSH